MSLENCKLKQRATTTHQLEWPKSKTLTTPSAGKAVEQREFSFIAGGNAKWFNHFGELIIGIFYFLVYSSIIS